MAAETYKYFAYDTNLRADYGGGAIPTGAGSLELTGLDYTQRYIMRELGYPKTGVNTLFRSGTVTGAVWAKVSDNLYPAIEPYLTASELASVVSTAPVGFTNTSTRPIMIPEPRRKNVIADGDSISAGTSTTGGLSDAPVAIAMRQLDATVDEHPTDPSLRSWVGLRWAGKNLAIGGSSWNNTVDTGDFELFPYRYALRYASQVQTLPLDTTERLVYDIWLGTNDLSYDSGLSADDAFARAETWIGTVRAEFPSLKIIANTLIRRSEVSALNDRIRDFNILMRANYATIGADYLVDNELAHADFSASTGNSASSNYAGDGVHLSTAGSTIIATAKQAAYVAALGA